MKTNFFNRTAAAAVLTLAAQLLAPLASSAADGTWTNTATGTQDWGNAANWANGIVATNTDATAFFNTIPVPSGGITVTVDSGDTVGNLFFGDTAANNPYIFSGQPLTLSASSGTANITVSNASQTATFNSQVVNDPSLLNVIQKNGPGTIVLNSNLTQSLQWTINGGTVSIGYPNGDALTAPFGSFTANAVTLNGGTLNLSYLYFSENNLGFTLGTNGGAINVSGGYSAIDGNIMYFTGPGGLTKKGSGTLGLRPGGGYNDYQGDTVVAQGTLQYRYNDNVIPDGPGFGNVIVSSGATLDLSGRNDTINGLSGGGNVDNTTGSQSYDSTLTIGNNDANGIFTGLIANNNGAGKVLNLVKEGAGTETFSGANSYKGSTTISGGVLNTTTLSSNADYTVSGATLGVTVVNPPSSLAVSNFTLNTGATLNINFGTNANPASSAIYVAGNYALNDNVTINISGNNLSPGSVTLLQFAGANNSSGGVLALGTLPLGMTATLVDNTATPAKNVVLNITSAGCFLTYVAGTNGTITGSTNQLVALGGSGTAVTAVANGGFVFSSWSDGNTNATRTDTNVTGSVTYTAKFVSASAVNGIWTQTATNTQTWITSGNWSGGIVATNIDAVANFSTINVPSGGQTVTVDAGRTVGSLLLGDTSGSDAYTFSGSTLNLAVSSGNAGIVAANPGQSCTFNNAISSSSLIEKSGLGQINLRANATQFQKWLISGGTVNFDANTRLTLNPASFTADAITLNGGTLQLNYLYLNNANMGITLGAAGGTINSPSGTSSLDNNASYITGPGSLTKAGAGVLNFRPNGNTYTGDTIIAAGILRLNYYDNCVPSGAGKGNLVVNSGATFDLAGQVQTVNGLSGSGIVDNSTTSGNNNNSTLTIGNNNTSSTFNGILRNSSATKFLNITKTGSGIINLLGVNTNNGSITINAGALYVSTTSSNGSYSVASGATLGVVCVNTNSSLGLTNLTFVNTATLAFNLGSVGNPLSSIINAAGNLAVSNTVTVNIYGSHLQTGTITLLTFAGTKSGSGAFVLGPLPPGMAATLTDNTGAGSKNLLLNITAVPTKQDIRWAVGNGNWDITTANWQIISNSASSTYLDDYTVLLDDNNSSTANLIAVTLAQNVTPVAVTVSNNAKSYVLSGAYGINGSTGLSKQGTGSVTVATANTYSGNTTIGGGNIKLGVANALPANSSVVMNPASGTAKLDLTGFSTVINGLNNSGAGTSIVDNSTGSATLTVGNNNADSVFGGSIRNTGGTLNLTKAGTGILNLTASNSYSGKTILTGGTLVINSKDSLGATPAALTSDQLTLGATTGSTTVTLSNTASITFADVNRGVTVRDSGAFLDAAINTPAGTTLTIAGSLSATASGTTVGLQKAGNGVLVLSNATSYNATLELDAGTVQFNSALNSGIFLKNLGLVILGGGDYTAGMGFGGGLHQLYGNAGYAALGTNRTVALGGGIVTWGDGNFSPNYLILGSTLATHTLIFSSSINLNGATQTIQADHGTAAVDGLITGVLTNGSLTKVGLGTLELSATNVYTGATTINAGKLMLASTGSIGASSAITINTNATFDVSLVSGFTIGAAQTVQGSSGTLLGNVTVNGLLAPGISTNLGVLTISNNLTLAGNTVMKLSKSQSPSNDLVAVVGQLNYGGTLTPTNIDVGSLVAGDSFQLFKAGSVTGNFASIAGSPGVGLVWNFSPASGVLSVVSSVVPQPHITSISFSGTSLVINGTNGTSGQQYEVLTSTNLTVPLTNWVSIATNQFPGNAFSVTNTVSPGTPQHFYILRVP